MCLCPGDRVFCRLEQPGRLQAVLSELLDFGPLPVGPPDYVTEMIAECEEMAGAKASCVTVSLVEVLLRCN